MFLVSRINSEATRCFKRQVLVQHNISQGEGPSAIKRVSQAAAGGRGGFVLKMDGAVTRRRTDTQRLLTYEMRGLEILYPVHAIPCLATPPRSLLHQPLLSLPAFTGLSSLSLR
ncbi:hypothetical protein E2C01_071963 [Portunus trituberculatus]|uniref:Uncharacterized protein n=1 Tax=Portunus trituberculatus TaxID=210409 RepID=A0A5B7I7N5_PORTR|nr:hypothetical protein [Portunus trituberculatus]